MKKSKKGFTLVELLVVIAIIAIIAAVAIPVTIGQINKSKVKTAKNEADGVFGMVELAIADQGGANLTKALLKTYVESNFKDPEYVTKIEITKASGEIKVTTAGQKIDGSNEFVTKTLSTTNKAMIGENITLTYTAKTNENPSKWE